MPAGRPTKYDPSMCSKVVELMGDGCSKAEVCKELDICFDSFQAYQEKHKEFSEAVKKGMQLAQGWWESQGRVNLKDRDFSPTLWFMNMKNRFSHDWRDKKEVDTNNTHHIESQTDEELDNRIKSLMSEMDANTD